MSRVSRALLRALSAVSLAAPLAVAPLGADPAAAASPWWCAPDAVLLVTSLPDVLPAAACSLDGRAIVGHRGYGVSVPPVGYGVASTVDGDDGGETVGVWTDEYVVHVRGGEYVAALGYLDAMRVGAADRADLARMAAAVRSMTSRSIGRVRPQPALTSELLDAADSLVASYASTSSPPDALAVERLATFFSLAHERDDSPSLRELLPLPDAIRAAIGAREIDWAAADRVLTDAVLLHTLVRGEVDASSPDAPADIAQSLADAVAELRAAIARGGVTVDLDALDTDVVDRMLQDLFDYVAAEVAPEDSPEAPGVTTPDSVNLTDELVAGSSPPPCEDGARAALYPEKSHWARGSVIKWYYNHDYHVPGYTAAEYLDAITQAFDNVTKLHDDCGYSWRPNVSNDFLRYAAQTLPQPHDSIGRCAQKSDGVNIVGWRTMYKPGDLAWACTFRVVASTVTGFDVAIGRNRHWDVPEYNSAYGYVCNPSGSQPEADVEAVMTHEFGHVLALDHVAEETHRHLTMSAGLNAYCGRTERTPGRGDAIGWGNLYGRIS